MTAFLMTLKNGIRQNKKSLQWAVGLAALLAVAIVLFSSVKQYQFRQAAFFVEAAQRYVAAAEAMAGTRVFSLADMPEASLTSGDQGFSLDLARLRARIVNGYFYDLQRYPDGRYVISASPIRWLTPRVEFGITDDGVIRGNTAGVDPAADSYDEVKGWRPVYGADRIVTRVK